MDGFINVLSSFTNYIMTVDMFPVFFLVDFSIGSLLVRNDSNHLGPKFRQKHPFTSWLCTIITCLSGAFIASFLFGDPLLDIMKENKLVAYLTLIWYLINYSPFDIVYKVVMHPVILIPFCVLQECVRLRFLYLGVQTAAKAYPTAPLIIMMGGIIKGNGYGFIKVVERLIRGLWDPKNNEALEVSYFTKSACIGSLLFLLHFTNVLRIPIEYLYVGILAAFISGRLILMLGGVSDPLAPLEGPFSRLLFGSWEEGRPGKPEPKPKDNRNKGGGDANKDNIKAKNGDADINKNNNKNNNKKKNSNAKKPGNKKKD